jgi:hypothetical protein
MEKQIKSEEAEIEAFRFVAQQFGNVSPEQAGVFNLKSSVLKSKKEIFALFFEMVKPELWKKAQEKRVPIKKLQEEDAFADEKE